MYLYLYWCYVGYGNSPLKMTYLRMCYVGYGNRPLKKTYFVNVYMREICQVRKQVFKITYFCKCIYIFLCYVGYRNRPLKMMYCFFVNVFFVSVMSNRKLSPMTFAILHVIAIFVLFFVFFISQFYFKGNHTF